MEELAGMCRDLLRKKLEELGRDDEQLAKVKLGEILSVMDNLTEEEGGENQLNINIKVI